MGRAYHRTVASLCLWVMLGMAGEVAADDAPYATPRAAARAAARVAALSASERARVHEEALQVLGGHTNVVSRWDGDIRFAILGGKGEGGARVARETIDEVIAQTGLGAVPIEPVSTAVDTYLDAARRSPDYRLAPCEAKVANADDAVCANFVVLIADIASVRALADAIGLRAVYRRSLESADDDGVNCFFAPFQNARRRIVRAFVFVQQGLMPAMRRTCLQEEIYQAFGLFNDVTGSRFFSFDNRVEPKRITAFDRALLASVYAPGVAPGTPVFTVVARFMRLLEAQSAVPGATPRPGRR